jgi:hypothetical protein
MTGQYTQIIQWALWVGALLAGVGAVLALFKLRYAERFLPDWNKLKEIEATLPVRQEQFRQVSETLQSQRQQLAKLDGEVGELRKLREWDRQNPDARARISQMIVDLERGKAELAAIQQKLAQEEARINDLTRMVQELAQKKSHLEGQVPGLSAQLASLHKQVLDHESRRLDLEHQCRELAGTATGLKTDIQAHESRLNTLRPQVEKAEQDRAKAERERKEAEAARDVAREEVANLQKLKESLEQLLKRTETTLEKTGVTGAKGYSDLFAPIFSAGLAPARSVQQERDALERTRDYIKGKGLVFPERVLYAFHTSLKASDISPLVVLAGISGTGKSELPRHYADGMGMHFLLSAVQPRWDSPQDLFGFYNYLEKKYRATELARALVQFEIHNRQTLERLGKDQGAELDSRSDRMLLVLLDEMNLARTEYYFSEFLSKLETRRMVDEGNAQQRARAEIELDMGSLLGGQTAIRLYPGKNVLFTGTMNEDESTQALSDKVVDRASVLRFWRPKRTNLETGQHQHAPPANGLTLDNWKRWLRTAENLSPHGDQVTLWINQLNDALEKLGRPFAFRVDRAIRCYIANYPRETVQDWHKRAMADQIEQRIFPKLRGAETEFAQDPLQGIGRVIDELGDEPLRQAYRASYENQPTFLFRGVVRSDD